MNNYFFRASNWEADELSPAQSHYAALDAWVSRQILVTLWEVHSSPSGVSLRNFCEPHIDRKPPKIKSPKTPKESVMPQIPEKGGVVKKEKIFF
jgi:hypothetical protein